MFSNDGGQEIATRFIVPHAVRLRSVTWFGGHPGALDGRVRDLPPDDAIYWSDYRILLFEDAGDRPAATFFRGIEASVLRVPTGAQAGEGAWLWGPSLSGQSCFFRVGSRPWEKSEQGASRAFTLYGVPG
jgi:hypothetical protein